MFLSLKAVIRVVDKKRADLARPFLTKLATKDDTMYNQFVDIFSVLTQEGPLDGGLIVKRICMTSRFSFVRVPMACVIYDLLTAPI